MSQPSLLRRTAIVITASDRCFAGTQEDRSGPAVAELLKASGAHVIANVIAPDDLPLLMERLREAAGRAALVVTTGGTGLSARDNTPEGTLAGCGRLVAGIA